jgi:ribosomal protein S5
VKIIAGTGVATTDVTEHLTKLGVKHILAKPYTTETMLKALRQVIGALQPQTTREEDGLMSV